MIASDDACLAIALREPQGDISIYSTSQGGWPQTQVASISSSVESRASQSSLQYAAPSRPPVTVQLHSWYSQGWVKVLMPGLVPRRMPAA